jgi:hypothetical protein
MTRMGRSYRLPSLEQRLPLEKGRLWTRPSGVRTQRMRPPLRRKKSQDTLVPLLNLRMLRREWSMFIPPLIPRVLPGNQHG